MSELVKRRLRMQVRATPDKGEGTGQAIVSTYDLAYDIGWGLTERILPGCFANSISQHGTIPIFYNHEWGMGPVGSGKPTEADDQLTVDFALYLNQGDLVGRVYQAMLDAALEEWSIGFWPTAITSSKDDPMCDQIAEGDLAEASVCVRGANPETGTLDLAGKTAWMAGDEPTRERELIRIRSLIGAPVTRDAGHTHEHAHSDGTVHSHAHTHSAGNYGHDEADPEITHDHGHDDDEPGDGGTSEDPGPDESARAAAGAARLMSTPWGREILAAQRQTEGTPS
jgi:HK97 family phage prohead protease